MSYTELSHKEVRATRKAHTCEWCAEPVEIGSPANHRTYIFEGDFHSEYMHPECHEAMDDTPMEYIEDGWIAGDWKRGSNEGR